jgi:pimeloyl-ACP methyl ester carboxylesterase
MLGSPENWSVMIDELAGAPSVRARFQFLTFGYNSFQAISDSGRELLEALAEMRRRLDLAGCDDSFDRVVLVGHSLGGLVAKAAATYAPSPQPFQSADQPHVGPARPRVARIIFIATPHRGTPVDRGVTHSLGVGLARVVSRSIVVRKTGSDASALRSSTSVDQITWDNPLLGDLERARAAARIPFHSIIATLRQPSADEASDGLVPVASARLEGARSEVVVRTPHACYRHPDVIREVHRVIGEHAAALTRTSRSGSVDLPPLGSFEALLIPLAPSTARDAIIPRNEPPADARCMIRPEPIGGAHSAGQERRVPESRDHLELENDH